MDDRELEILNKIKNNAYINQQIDDYEYWDGYIDALDDFENKIKNVEQSVQAEPVEYNFPRDTAVYKNIIIDGQG